MDVNVNMRVDTRRVGPNIQVRETQVVEWGVETLNLSMYVKFSVILAAFLCY